MIAMSNMEMNLQKPAFKHFAKMTKLKKMQLITDSRLNDLEKFMLDSECSPSLVNESFKNTKIENIKNLFKSIKDMNVKICTSFDILESELRRAHSKLIENIGKRNIHKFQILSLEVSFMLSFLVVSINYL